MFNCTCDCLCRLFGSGVSILLFIVAMVVGVGLVCYYLVEIVEGLLKAKDAGTIKTRVFRKTLCVLVAVLIGSVFPTFALSFVADAFSMDEFQSNFPIIFAVLSFYVSIIVSLTTYFYQKKEEKEKEQQETTLHNDLEDIKQQLKDIKDNLPTKQDTPTSKDSLLSRLLRSLCGEK